MTTQVLEETDRLVLKRTYQTTLSAMWAAWTEPAHIEQWFGCSQTKNVTVSADLQTGGELRIEMEGGENDPSTVLGRYTEVTPKTRLGYTWQWLGSPEMEFGETKVLLEFREVDEGVELTLTHSGFPTPELTGMHQHGWSDALVKLESVLAAG